MGGHQALIEVLGAPSAIGISPYRECGARRLDLAPGALREHGLAAVLNAADGGDETPPGPYRDYMRPAGRCRNEDGVADYSRTLADRIAAAHRNGHFVVLVGGDCSILLGALLGLRKAGRGPVGLAYVDAHADFATLEQSPSGSPCSMNLALAVGRAERPLARLAGDHSLVRGEHVVHIGRRDQAEPEYGYGALVGWGVLDLPDSALDAIDVAGVVVQALARVTTCEAGFWIHFDVDVLDPELMPAVDSPLPGGLDLRQAAALLAPLVHHPQALGLQVTNYDPALDPNRVGPPRLVGLLEHVFSDRSARQGGRINGRGNSFGNV
jgi:arginase